MCNRGSALVLLDPHREACDALTIAPNQSLGLSALENRHAASCQREGITDLRLQVQAAALQGT
jgi:hypothetical protein